MKLYTPMLTLSLTICAFVIGVTTGYFFSPSYQITMNEPQTMGFGNADRFVDLRYIDQMAAHHRGAMLLAGQIQQKTQRQEIKDLAADILKNEPPLIEELYTWKKDWYKDTRRIKDPIVANLGPADDKTDLRFLNALIAHHSDGIAMTKEIRTKSSRADVLNNADAVENFLTTTSVTLKNWREQWYGVK